MNPKLKSLARTKAQLREQVEACSLRNEALLTSVKAFTECSWNCFLERKIEIPTRTTFTLVTWFGGLRHATKQTPEASPVKAHRFARKALMQFDRDMAFCWDKLTAAVSESIAGTRPAIRAINARSKWRAEYDARIDLIERNCKREHKGTGRQAKILEFAKQHGAVHLVAGTDRMFASEQEALEYMSTTKEARDFSQRAVAAQSAENQRLIALFEGGLWK